MNSRIRPHDLDSSAYKELIHSLTLQWFRSPLPSQGMSYVEYSDTIRTLLLTTQSPARTSQIVEAVIAQAIELRKTSVWVEQELKFEGMLDGADRADFLRLELEEANGVDDVLLDQYNERLNRFGSSEH